MVNQITFQTTYTSSTVQSHIQYGIKSWLNVITYSFFILLLMFYCNNALADNQMIPVVAAKQAQDGTTYSLSIKILAIMTLLAVLPALLITTTAFTRIIVVLAIFRQALGIPNMPSNQIIIGLSLILTLFIMLPTVEKVNEISIQPYISGKIQEEQAISLSSSLLKTFMMKQTRKADLQLFNKLAHKEYSKNAEPSLLVLAPAFITSELKTAFKIGFLVFLPFLIIDIVVASVLMSMGMMMLSPMVISLPFKILFFVLVDGWGLLVTSLVASFRT